MAASAEKELGNVLDVKLDANGLLTAVTIDVDTNEVLMVAFMNKEALERTVKTGKCTYWSRSRSKFWVKGEESGHVQLVQSVTIDCDQDAVVVKVKQKGAACHNGFHNCFYRQIVENADGSLALKTIATPEVDPAKIYKK